VRLCVAQVLLLVFEVRYQYVLLCTGPGHFYSILHALSIGFYK
jgi:hypothetical protein